MNNIIGEYYAWKPKTLQVDILLLNNYQTEIKVLLLGKQPSTNKTSFAAKFPLKNQEHRNIIPISIQVYSNCVLYNNNTKIMSISSFRFQNSKIPKKLKYCQMLLIQRANIVHLLSLIFIAIMHFLKNHSLYYSSGCSKWRMTHIERTHNFNSIFSG